MKNRSSGYTLVELLSALAILALVFSLAWPKYQAWADELALRQDAAVLARELRLARQEAITRGQECAVVFKASSETVKSTSYQIRQGRKLRTVSLRRGVETVGTRFPPDPVSNSDRHSACRFYPLGNPNRGGTVHLRNSRHQSLYVVVTPVTARVRITDTDPGI